MFIVFEAIEFLIKRKFFIPEKLSIYSEDWET